MKLSVVIPAYNEKDTIEEVIRRVSEVDIPKEIIVVDDSSTDGTSEMLGALEKRYPIRVFRNPVNMGKGAAVRLGYRNCTGDVVIVQDADLELDPGEYGSLMEPIRKGEAEVVFGSRFLSGGRGKARAAYLANLLLTRLTNILFRTDLTDMETCYKLLKRSVLDSLRLEASGFDIEPEITAKVARAGFRIREVPIRYTPRTVEEGKKIGWKDGIKAVWALLKYRLQPLDRCVKRKDFSPE